MGCTLQLTPLGRVCPLPFYLGLFASPSRRQENCSTSPQNLSTVALAQGKPQREEIESSWEVGFCIAGL